MKQSYKALLGLALGIILYKVIDGGCAQKAADGAGGDRQTYASVENERDNMESPDRKPYVNPFIGLAFPIQAHLYPVWFEKEGGGFLFFVDEADREGARDVPGANRVAKIRGEVFPTPSRVEKTAWQKSPGQVPYALEQRVQQEGGEGEWQLLVPAGAHTLQLVADAGDRALLAAIAEGLTENE
ncbi:MAG: hypothetical protein HKN20_10335 [Gemmatimonadetes bacterium]|nr:hypothetical protein [Gemmatimonadota bacterium]